MSNEIKLILSTHIAFYKRHPWLMVLFVIGFSLGSALLTAITGLNQEAKSRYQQSSALIDNPVSHIIKPLTGEKYLDGHIWLALKQLGFINAQPVLRGRLKVSNSRSIAIQGVDTLMWLNSLLYKQQASQTQSLNSQLSLSSVIVDSQFEKRIFGNKLVLPENVHQPEIIYADDVGLWAMTDLAHADYLLNAQGQLSFIELSSINEQDLARITSLIKDKAQIIDADKQDFDVLSEAFFFNLTALALLGYIVAAFLSFNAIKLTIASRRQLLIQIFTLGCTKNGIQISLGVELIVLSLFTALLGSVGGYFIANSLVLDVNRTLMGLYELDKALVIHWQWTNVLLGFVLNSLAIGVILLTKVKQASSSYKAVFYALLFTTLALMLWLFNYANNEYQALLLCFTIIVLFVLLVPKALSSIVSLPMKFSNPLSRWVHADTSLHLKDLHIAIIAILVALGSAIGMQIMVKSFSDSLGAHLEKQLSADIYLRSSNYDPQLRDALSQLPEVKLLSIYKQSEGSVNGSPAQLAAIGRSDIDYRHIWLTSGKGVTAQNFTDHSCIANEQSSIKYGLKLNQKISFKQNNSVFECRISGFFYDYGNPSILLMTLEQRLVNAKFNTEFFGYSIRLHDNSNIAKFTEKLINDFKQDSTLILTNKRFKDFANRLFDDTFVVTKALNSFILAIALLSLCTSLLSLSANQLKQLRILQNLGVTSNQLLKMKLLQTGLIITFTALFSVPLGFALGYALLKFVMPIAFGWTIHFSFDSFNLIMTCLILILVSTICAYLPIRKLTQLNKKEV